MTLINFIGNILKKLKEKTTKIIYLIIYFILTYSFFGSNNKKGRWLSLELGSGTDDEGTLKEKGNVCFYL